MMKSSLRNTIGFTLIELLIVVAIIAILAAIAVPNFLEAQTRAKVSRALTDMRTMRIGLESYFVDTNRYPETDKGLADAGAPKLQTSFLRLTTPIAYLSSVPASAFVEKYGTGGSAKIASALKSYLYVRKAISRDETPFDAGLFPQLNASYAGDRLAYIEQNSLGLVSIAQRGTILSRGEWLIKSVGPDNLDDRDAGSGSPTVNARPGWTALSARAYDPTNGTVSWGDVVTYSDRSGTGK